MDETVDGGISFGIKTVTSVNLMIEIPGYTQTPVSNLI